MKLLMYRKRNIKNTRLNTLISSRTSRKSDKKVAVATVTK